MFIRGSEGQPGMEEGLLEARNIPRGLRDFKVDLSIYQGIAAKGVRSPARAN